MTKPIKFGTDGWRAVIADDFTFDNVSAVADATARWLRREYGDGAGVVIGHDTRFMGRAFTERVAQVFHANAIKVIFAHDVATTPAISWAAQAYGQSAGIVITASHNPPEYNGFKIKAHFGGPATPEMIAAVEAEIDGSFPSELKPFDDLSSSGLIMLRDVESEYEDVLRKRLDIRAIRESGMLIAHDAMYGAGRGVIGRLLGKDHVVELRSDVNPGFGGSAPEPIERNLGLFAATVVRDGCAVGIANDGDADRVGMFDEKGQFVSSHLILALLLKYLHRERGMSGSVVKTFSTTHMLDRMGEAYGLEVVTTPIGFKYIASRIVEGDVLIGGEESGGMAVKGHIPERDGIYIGLLVVEMMVKRGRRLSELVDELFHEFGGHYQYRVDAHTTEDNKASILERLASGRSLDRVAGRDVRRVETLDGYKHILDEGWLLIRPSGTEPVLRIYSEAENEDESVAIVNDALSQLGL